MLWSRLRCLLQLANSPEFENSAEDFACQFANKVMKIRASTANAPPPVITDRPVVEPLTQFNPVTPEEVATVLKKCPSKTVFVRSGTNLACQEAFCCVRTYHRQLS